MLLGHAAEVMDPHSAGGSVCNVVFAHFVVKQSIFKPQQSRVGAKEANLVEKRPVNAHANGITGSPASCIGGGVLRMFCKMREVVVRCAVNACRGDELELVRSSEFNQTLRKTRRDHDVVVHHNRPLALLRQDALVPSGAA